MKITFSRNINDIGCAIEANKDEIGCVRQLKALADKFQKEMTRAYEAAEKVFKEYPDFKQVTLDTMTDEVISNGHDDWPLRIWEPVLKS